MGWTEEALLGSGMITGTYAVKGRFLFMCGRFEQPGKTLASVALSQHQGQPPRGGFASLDPALKPEWVIA